MPSIHSVALCLAVLASTAVAQQDTANPPRTDLGRALRTAPRNVPSPSPDHPGNVFLADEEVEVTIPPEMRGEAAEWRLLDDHGDLIRHGRCELAGDAADVPRTVRPGRLGIGWYRIEILDRHAKQIGWTSAAVLAKLAEPVPQDSPICVDSATAWFAKDDPQGQARLSRLAALAGVNWVRDRLRWGEIQPDADTYRDNTTYDTSATIHSRDGLKVLQVFHNTPAWAAGPIDGRGRFPPDLRIAYRSCKALAQRFGDRVQAWEPWNEANVRNFGGHAIDQICSYQKAAYLGFKAGDPRVVVGWNALAGTPTEIHARGVLENETWPYYDTYNTHTYDWPESYVRLWAPIRAAACGRPIWITEADRGIPSETGPPWYDLSPRYERLKAQFMAQSYATSLFAGSNRHFHFILGHYCEQGGKIQFGLLRFDQTPRPSYVALAALGRLLAGARCLGRWRLEDEPNAHVFAFRARPDGVERDVLVAWAEKPGGWDDKGKTTALWSLPQGVAVQRVFDYLGRALAEEVPKKLASGALFVILRSGDAEKLPLERPASSEFRGGSPSPVVLQLRMPPASKREVSEQPWAGVHAHVVDVSRPVSLELYAYNFSDTTVRGTISAERTQTGWKLVDDRFDVTLEPMQRKRLTCKAVKSAHAHQHSTDSWIKLRGDFSDAGRPTLAFRLLGEDTSDPSE